MLGRVRAWLRARDQRHLVVAVVGDCLAADRLRAWITRAPSYTLSAFRPQFTFHVEEAPVACVTFDGVRGALEMYVSAAIEELTPGREFHVLGGSGQNFDDAALRMVCPPDDAHRFAVAEGTVRGLDQLRQGLR